MEQPVETSEFESLMILYRAYDLFTEDWTWLMEKWARRAGIWTKPLRSKNARQCQVFALASVHSAVQDFVSHMDTLKSNSAKMIYLSGFLEEEATTTREVGRRAVVTWLREFVLNEVKLPQLIEELAAREGFTRDRRKHVLAGPVVSSQL